MRTDSSVYRATPKHHERVVEALESCAGPGNARHIAEIAALAGMPSLSGQRLVRAAYADLDGDAFVLGRVEGWEGGLFVATTREEAASLDRELRTKALSLLKRLRARRAYWKRQSEIKQLDLFGTMKETA